MSYHEDPRTEVCGKCQAVNHLLVAYSGDGRANEQETAKCFNCGNKVFSEKCWSIISASSAEGALQQLRAIQNRP
jgi:ribosomal protein S27AE